MAGTAPFFIVGAPRSGTTLLARILGAHPRLFVPGETHFFPDIFARRDSIGDLADGAARERLRERLSTLYGRYNEPRDQQRVAALMQQDGFLADAARLTSHVAALDYFMQEQMRCAGKIRWGNHVPRDLFHVEDITGFYPEARFVACVRDARDFLGSYKYKWQATAPEQRDRLRRLYHPVITSLLWRASARRLQTLLAAGDTPLLLVRYEDLVARPGETLRGVCEFLGETFHEAMLDIDFSNSSRTGGGSGAGARRGGDARRGVDESSVGTWRETLSQEEAWLAQRIAGRAMDDFGYRREALAPGPTRVAALLASTPWALGVALRANAANRGPLLPYLARRVRALVRA